MRLRHEKAQLMGYEMHADFVTEVRMSKSAAKVKAFLSGSARSCGRLGRGGAQGAEGEARARRRDGGGDDVRSHVLLEALEEE